MVVMERLTDAELVQMARVKNKDAFSQLVERYQVMAMYLAVRFTRNEEVARELVQESMLQAYLSLDKLEEEARFKSWFYAIVLNVCRSWRRAQRYTSISLDTQEGNRHVEQSPYLIQDVQEQWVEHELQHQLQEAVAILPLPNREAVYLFYYEGLNMQEIADRLHITLPAVKGRLHKGRNQLRVHFKELCLDDESIAITTTGKKINFLKKIFTRVVHAEHTFVKNVYHEGKILQNHKETSIIWVGLFILGLPLLAEVALTNSILLAFVLPAWLICCVGAKSLAQWLKQNTSLNGGVLLPIGIPLAILVFVMINKTAPIVPDFYGENVSLLITYCFLALWSIVSILLMRTGRSLYLTLHILNWLFWLGTAIIIAPWQLYSTLWLGMSNQLSPLQVLAFLAFPLSITFIISKFSASIMQFQMPIILERTQPLTTPKTDDPQGYEQGYHPAYEEGGTTFLYKEPSEEPIAEYPQQQKA